MRTIRTEITIDAPPARVWDVLVDGAALEDWNPFVRSLEGELVVGARLRVRLQQPGGRPITMRPTVTALEPARQLTWLGRLGVPGLFDGEHSFLLEPLDDGARTRFVHGERFRGLLVPLLGGTITKAEAGFRAMNEALKARVEGAPDAEGSPPGDERAG